MCSISFNTKLYFIIVNLFYLLQFNETYLYQETSLFSIFYYIKCSDVTKNTQTGESITESYKSSKCNMCSNDERNEKVGVVIDINKALSCFDKNSTGFVRELKAFEDFQNLKDENKLNIGLDIVKDHHSLFPVLLSMTKYLKKYKVILKNRVFSLWFGSLVESLKLFSEILKELEEENKTGLDSDDKKFEDTEHTIFISNECNCNLNLVIHMQILHFFYLLQLYQHINYKIYRCYVLWYIEHINGRLNISKGCTKTLFSYKLSFCKFLKNPINIKKERFETIQNLDLKNDKIFTDDYFDLLFLCMTLPISTCVHCQNEENHAILVEKSMDEQILKSGESNLEKFIENLFENCEKAEEYKGILKIFEENFIKYEKFYKSYEESDLEFKERLIKFLINPK